MLDNTITLAVDEANTDVTTDHVYTRYDEYNNRTVYAGPNHEPGSKEELTFYRTFPKVNGNFKGVKKTAFKFAIDVVVPGVDGENVQSTQIFEVSTSIPVGVTVADQVKMRQRGVAVLDGDTLMNLFHDKQNI